MSTRAHYAIGLWLASVVTAATLVASGAFAATIANEKYFLQYTVADEVWKPAAASSSDIVPSIVSKAFTGAGGGLIVTAKREDYVFTAREWSSAVAGGLGADKTIRVESSSERTVGKIPAVVVTLTGRGTGMRMGSGQSALRRTIVLIPNGPDVVQFILTA